MKCLCNYFHATISCNYRASCWLAMQAVGYAKVCAPTSLSCKAEIQFATQCTVKCPKLFLHATIVQAIGYASMGLVSNCLPQLRLFRIFASFVSCKLRLLRTLQASDFRISSLYSNAPITFLLQPATWAGLLLPVLSIVPSASCKPGIRHCCHANQTSCSILLSRPANHTTC